MIRLGNCWLKESTIDSIFLRENEERRWEVWVSSPSGNFVLNDFDEINDAIDYANKIAQKILGEEVCL